MPRRGVPLEDQGVAQVDTAGRRPRWCLRRAFFAAGRRASWLTLPLRDHQLLVRIPVGTVAFEELAFRGVLLDMLLRQRGPGPAVGMDSALFGLWHVVPTLATAAANGIAGRRRLALVAGSVLCTTAGGVAFCALRLRCGQLLAPALLHLALNDVDTGYALSWWVRSGVRRR
jgi:membrane protease YdiL (CAAX protease family)